MTDTHALQPLYTAALAGDAHALSALLDKVSRYMRSEAKRFCDDKHDLDELVQGALLKIWRNLPAFLAPQPPLEKFINWAKKAVRHLAFDLLRHRKAFCVTGLSYRVIVPGHEDRLLAADRADHRACPITHQRNYDDLRCAVAQLPEKYRLVVELACFDRVKHAKVAQRLGITARAVGVLRCRAIKRLRKIMEEQKLCAA